MGSLFFENFIISTEKNFIEDPVYGIETLSEVAAKALSPAVNDPGTAINVIDAINRCLKYLFELKHTADQEITYKNLYIDDINAQRFIQSGFEYIRIYGSSNLLVAARIQKSLIHISKQIKNDECSKFIKNYISNCLEQANTELKYNFEKKELKEFIERLNPKD